MKRIFTYLRPIVYFLCLFILAVSVKSRISEVQRQRASVPPSYISEIKTHGKPVTAVKVEPGTFNVRKKITVVPSGGRKLEGCVTQAGAALFDTGQKVFIQDQGKEIHGMVSYISTDVDPVSGLYRIVVDAPEGFTRDNGSHTVEVKVAVLENALFVPDEALVAEEDEFYVWKIVENKAYIVKVELAERSGGRTVISSGLVPGDTVVVTGRSILEDGDGIRRVEEMFLKQREP